MKRYGRGFRLFSAVTWTVLDAIWIWKLVDAVTDYESLFETATAGVFAALGLGVAVYWWRGWARLGNE